ncbi:MAG TPA: transposase [Cellvibrionaceae bacterium]
MANYRRLYTSGASYFFTLVTYRRQPILCDESIRTTLRKAIEQTREKYPFEINAWVLLPDHLHTIWTLPPGDADYSLRWQQIKRKVSLAVGKEYKRADLQSPSKTKHRESTLWQRRYWEHKIRTQKDFDNHLNYCHYNPVKHGLTKQPKDWPYSTFHRYVKMGWYCEDWACAPDDMNELCE